MTKPALQEYNMIFKHMKSNTILIMGGYGSTGRVIAKLLLQESNAELIIAGRDLNKAESLAGELNSQFPENRVSAVQADASDAGKLVPLFSKARMVVVASSTSVFTEGIANAALQAGADYMDIHFGPAVYRRLTAMKDKIEGENRCFISGGGFHPGLPAALVRYAGQGFDHMETAVTSGAMNIDFSTYQYTPSTRREFVEELAGFNPMFFKDGKWQKMNLLSTRDMIQVDFGGSIGKKNCSPLFFDELQPLPALFPGLVHTGFYIAGFNGVVDYFLFPLVMLLQKLLPKSAIEPLSKLLIWGMKIFSRPPYGYVIKLEAEGLRNGKRHQMSLRVSHTDPSLITAAPVVACLRQYLNETRRRSGLWLQALYVEPKQFFAGIKRMGIECEGFAD